MVIMKYIDGLDSHQRFLHETLPPNILGDVGKAVKLLHNASLVFGDLRRPTKQTTRTASEQC
jgi:tRNA A-37 threonylcarbamoyl transferase component Bud32